VAEPKPIASLSSSLLARKGQAKPAMRPQGFASFGFGTGATHPLHEDLGWNDMGHDHAPMPQSAEVVPITPDVAVEAPVLSPAPMPAVVRQREEVERELAPIRAAATRAAPGSKGKAAFTLRLDPDRHLRLRLACAVAHTSAQQLVVQALDAWLDAQPAMGELSAAARNAK
jgi:hypothetical protein